MSLEPPPVAVIGSPVRPATTPDGEVARAKGVAAGVSGAVADCVAEVDHAVVEGPVVEQLEVEPYAPG